MEAHTDEEISRLNRVQGLISMVAKNANKQDKKARAQKRKQEEEEAPEITFSNVRKRARSSAVKGMNCN